MAKNINFNTGLLYLYWLMSGADGQKNFNPEDAEWKAMRLMRKHENIGDEDFDEFVNSDLGSTKDQLDHVISNLDKTTHAQKVRALAWMDLVMLADGNIHSKEYELYTQVRNKLGINEDEVKKDIETLPEV